MGATAAIALATVVTAQSIDQGNKARKEARDQAAKQEEQQKKIEVERSENLARNEATLDSQRARAKQRTLVTSGQGRGGTILTSPLGAASSTPAPSGGAQVPGTKQLMGT